MVVVARWVLFAYGLLLIAGGIAGYRKAKSRPSLIAGSASGVFALAAFAATFWSVRIGLWTGTGVAALLLVTMGIRFAKSKKFMPAGFVALLSLITFALTGSAALWIVSN